MIQEKSPHQVEASRDTGRQEEITIFFSLATGNVHEYQARDTLAMSSYMVRHDMVCRRREMNDHFIRVMIKNNILPASPAIFLLFSSPFFPSFLPSFPSFSPLFFSLIWAPEIFASKTRHAQRGRMRSVLISLVNLLDHKLTTNPMTKREGVMQERA